MGAAVLRGLVECGALTASEHGWVVDDAALAEVQTERRSTAVLVRRLDLLPEGVLRALSGTGYSPLTHLRSFPVDILKIDRSFVRNVVHSEEDRAIVRGVIDVAHRLGLRTVAEGIEKPKQLEIMRDLGCDSGQGYLWTQPVPLEALLTDCQ